VIYLQTCPHCGNAAIPGNKFCTRCGRTFGPDVPGKSAEKSPAPALPDAGSSGKNGTAMARRLPGAAGLIMVLLAVIFLIFLVLTGAFIFSSGNAAIPSKAPSFPVNGSSPGGSSQAKDTGVPVPVSMTIQPGPSLSMIPAVPVSPSLNRTTTVSPTPGVPAPAVPPAYTVTALAIPVIGSWVYTSSDGMIMTLTFQEDGDFSGTIGGDISPPGTWKEVSAHTYTVTLASGESWTYTYHADSDTLSDTVDPGISITRG
jgi:hypothetical protein